jgi:hypothetical protein
VILSGPDSQHHKVFVATPICPKRAFCSCKGVRATVGINGTVFSVYPRPWDSRGLMWRLMVACFCCEGVTLRDSSCEVSGFVDLVWTDDLLPPTLWLFGSPRSFKSSDDFRLHALI